MTVSVPGPRLEKAPDSFAGGEQGVHLPIEVPGYPSEYVGYVTEITPEILVGLGGLMHHLNPEYDGSPIAEEDLRDQIEGSSEQIIVIRDGYLAATASVSISRELYSGRNVQVGAVVVHPDYRGVKDEDGKTSFDHTMAWVDRFAESHGAEQIIFQVDPGNPRARAAYRRWIGATGEELDTILFVKRVLGGFATSGADAPGVPQEV